MTLWTKTLGPIFWFCILLALCAFGWDQSIERKRVEDENALLRDALALTGTAALFVEYSKADETWVFSNWDDNARSIFGYTEEEQIGKPITSIMPETKREHHTDKMRVAIAQSGESPNFIYQIECNGLHKDGSTPHIYLRTRYLPAEQRFLTLVDLTTNVVSIMSTD